MTSEHKDNAEERIYDDREPKIYGLENKDRLQINSAMVWVPAVIGMSVAAGVFTTRGLQRLFQGSSKVLNKPNVAASTATVESIFI